MASHSTAARCNRLPKQQEANAHGAALKVQTRQSSRQGINCYEPEEPKLSQHTLKIHDCWPTSRCRTHTVSHDERAHVDTQCIPVCPQLPKCLQNYNTSNLITAHKLRINPLTPGYPKIATLPQIGNHRSTDTHTHTHTHTLCRPHDRPP